MTDEKTDSSIPKLADLVDRMEKANQKKEELLRKEEEMTAKRLLGGQTDAGIQPVEKKEETPVEYKNRMLRGG